MQTCPYSWGGEAVITSSKFHVEDNAGDIVAIVKGARISYPTEKP
jgi:hypothetical protein